MFLNPLSNRLLKQQIVLTVLFLVIYYKPVVKEHFAAPQLSVLNFFELFKSSTCKTCATCSQSSYNLNYKMEVYRTWALYFHLSSYLS